MARSPQRAALVEDSAKKVANALTHQINGNMPMSYAELAKLIVDVGSPDNFKDVGALKVFKIPAGGPEGAKAYGRLETEVNALSSIQHSAVLKLLHHNRQKNFIVTEFHPQGTLNSHLIRFKGRALEALLAFRPLVEGVVRIHRRRSDSPRH